MAQTMSRPQRRVLTRSRRLLVVGSLLLGLLFVFAAVANFIDHDDLTEIVGEVHSLEHRSYWGDEVLYLRIEGAQGRFKIEHSTPGFAEMDAALSKGTAVRLWVDPTSLELDQPASIYQAEVDGRPLLSIDQTGAAHNRETWYVMLLGPLFWLLGFWIWHRATRPLASPEQQAAHQQRLGQLAERHWLLFLVVYAVSKVRQWGEEIPKFGDLFTVFLFFWILPLYIAFIFVTAQSYRTLVAIFCLTYAMLLFTLPIAALTMPNFPGANEYPNLGVIGSRLLNAYILLNLAYGGAMWVWGTLMVEPDAEVEPQGE